MSIKWMLPVSNSARKEEDFIHHKVKYHCFEINDNKDICSSIVELSHSFCGKYTIDAEYYETDIESGEILAFPIIGCKKCFDIWKKQFDICS